MLDLDAPIDPRRSAGGLTLGCMVDDILAVHAPLRVIQFRGDDSPGAGPVIIHSFGAIRTWSVRGIVQQIGVFEGYRGRTVMGSATGIATGSSTRNAADGIGIGSTLAEVRAVYGVDVVRDGEMVAIPGVPGLGIETTDWATPDQADPAAVIVQMFVHDGADA